MKNFLIFSSCCLLFFCLSQTKIAAWEKQELHLLNNQIRYGDWLPDWENLPRFHLATRRLDGKFYRFDRYFSHSAFNNGNSSLWVRRHATWQSDYFLLENSQSTYPILAHKLDNTERDFAYFTFQYKIRNALASGGNQPVAKLAICGKQYQWILDKHDERGLAQIANFDNSQEGWTTVTLANPGTCTGYSEIRYEMWLGTSRDYTQVKLRGFSFSDTLVYPEDEIWLLGDADQELALISDDRVMARGTQLQIAVNDWILPKLQVGTVIDEKVVATVSLANFLASENSPPAPDITSLVRETDQSLSGLAKFDHHQIWRRLELAIAPTAAALQFAWSEQTTLEDDFIANYQGLAYLSSANGGQVFHLPAAADLDWQAGFFLGAKLQNGADRWSGASQFWFCQRQECQKLPAMPATPLQLTALFLPTASHPQGQIELFNSSSTVVSLFGWHLRNQDADSLELTTLLDPGEKFIVTPPEPDWILAEGGALYLDNAAGELVEEFVYSSLDEPWSWQKNQITQNWKALYVR